MVNKAVIAVVVIFICSLLFQQESYGWGFFAHKRINRFAVFTLPPEILPFYKTHIEFLTEHVKYTTKTNKQLTVNNLLPFLIIKR
jgi:hypothetical protein